MNCNRKSVSRVVLLQVAVFVVCFLPASLASAARPKESPVEKGHFSVSGGGGVSQNSFSLGLGFGYFVLDGLMPGFSYQYTRVKDDFPKMKAAYHDLDIYLRYYFDLERDFFPFIQGDFGYLHYQEWGSGTNSLSADLYSVVGAGGLAYFITRNFYVDGLIGVRYYIKPPNWTDFYSKPTRLEYRIGFGVAF